MTVISSEQDIGYGEGKEITAFHVIIESYYITIILI